MKMLVHNVGASGLNLRIGAGTGFQRLRVMKEGELVELLFAESDWVLVRRANGETGWAFGQYLKPETVPAPDPKPEKPALQPSAGMNYVQPFDKNDPERLRVAAQAQGSFVGPEVYVNEYEPVATTTANLVVLRYQPENFEPDYLGYLGRAWTPEQWINHWWPFMAGVRRSAGHLIYQFDNELGYRHLLAQRVAWGVEFARVAREQFNLTVTLGNFAAAAFGTDENAAAEYQGLRPLVAAARKYGHWLRFNVYDFDDLQGPNRDTHFEYAARFLHTLGDQERPAWFIGELGHATTGADCSYRGPEAHAQLIGKTRRAYGSILDGAGWALWLRTAGDGWKTNVIPIEDLQVAYKAA